MKCCAPCLWRQGARQVGANPTNPLTECRHPRPRVTRTNQTALLTFFDCECNIKLWGKLFGCRFLATKTNSTSVIFGFRIISTQRTPPSDLWCNLIKELFNFSYANQAHTLHMIKFENNVWNSFCRPPNHYVMLCFPRFLIFKIRLVPWKTCW